MPLEKSEEETPFSASKPIQGPETSRLLDGGALRWFSRLIERASSWAPSLLAEKRADALSEAAHRERVKTFRKERGERMARRSRERSALGALSKNPFVRRDQKAWEAAQERAATRLKAAAEDWAVDCADEIDRFEVVRRALNEERRPPIDERPLEDSIFGGGPWIDNLLKSDPKFMARLSDWLVNNREKHMAQVGHEWRLACALTEKAQDMFLRENEKAPLLALATSQKGLVHPNTLSASQTTISTGGDVLDHAFALGAWDLAEAISRADWRKMSNLKNEKEECEEHGALGAFLEGIKRHEVRLWAYGVSELTHLASVPSEAFERAWKRVTQPWREVSGAAHDRLEAMADNKQELSGSTDPQNSAGLLERGQQEGQSETPENAEQMLARQVALEIEKALATSQALLNVVERIKTAGPFAADEKARSAAGVRDNLIQARALKNFSDKLIAENRAAAAMCLWLSAVSKVVASGEPLGRRFCPEPHEAIIAGFQAAAIECLSKTPKESDAQALAMLAVVDERTYWDWGDKRVSQKTALDDFAWNCAVGAWGKVRAANAWPAGNTGSHAKEAEIIALQAIVDDSKSAVDPISGKLRPSAPKRKSRRL